VRLYLFPHPDVGISIGVLAHCKKEALEVLKREREDIHIYYLLLLRKFVGDT